MSSLWKSSIVAISLGEVSLQVWTDPGGQLVRRGGCQRLEPDHVTEDGQADELACRERSPHVRVVELERVSNARQDLAPDEITHQRGRVVTCDDRAHHRVS